jgi:peptidoglycan/xylan/chitin deacetylase (PgdA/CDA1 family)
MTAVIPAGLTALTSGVLLHGAFQPKSPLFGRSISRGHRSSRALYLTFDDGPSPTATEQILKTLDAYHVPAAFFLVGDHVEKHPDLARIIGATEHEVGNHTQHHRKLNLKGPRFISQELERAHEVIVSTTGRSIRIFRAPHGYRNPFVTSVAHRLGYVIFSWTFGVWDTALPGAEEIRRRVRAKLKAGAIILLHDGDGADPGGDRSQTAAALPGIIIDAQNAGYSFKPITELLNP